MQHIHISVVSVLTVLFSLMIIGPLWHMGALVATQKGWPIGPAMAIAF